MAPHLKTATPYSTADSSWREFDMAFQAAVNTNTMRVFAYQATFRGPGGEKPADFARMIPDAERPTFDLKCRLAAISQAIKGGIMGMDVRLATRVLTDFIDNPVEDAERMQRIVRRLEFPADKLVLEFSELDDLESEKMTTLVHAYQQRGFTVAFNDFGSANDGLSLLNGFTPDTIKLPADLVHRLDQSWLSRMVVENIVAITEQKRIKLIAEGVDSRAEFDRLRQLGVPLMRGDYLAPAQIGMLSPFDPDQIAA
ncbi:EAL domain-containing protein [Sphingosinithalassobacter portus]|uniref:EAL domain-containing protein n=1 Tax=Stakelama portus TaxID=2676234 RepID=UPI000D6E6270|nr:EAL domain-containing protein [Sphingosinithalassobacter portus]